MVVQVPVHIPDQVSVKVLEEFWTDPTVMTETTLEVIFTVCVMVVVPSVIVSVSVVAKL